MSDQNFSEPITNLEFGNFDPDNLAADEVINVVLAVDVSYSMRPKADALNVAYNEFVDHFKKSHVSEKLMLSRIEFNDSIVKHTGFQPVTDLDAIDFNGSINGCTALYDAVKEGLQNALQYREDCEDSGITCKTLLFVITDGEDNSSGASSANDVNTRLGDLLSEERNAFSFTTILLGLGNENYFNDAAQKMGFDHVATGSDSAADIRKMINFISASISSVSQGKGIPTF
jgi:uncharacterized protein YegL